MSLAAGMETEAPAPPAPETAPSVQEILPPARATILVVDDTANIRQILVHLLEKEGYQTVQAKDGEEALSLVRMQKFDLVLLDIMMPKMTGYMVCEALRSRSDTRRLPVVMVTARGSKDAVLEAIRAGADDYVVKPFTSDVLLAKIRKVLARRRHREEQS
jgi:DNA-binding response OmpR family regulator